MVALKRQQAVEDAIALQLVSKETGETLTSLPQGRIYGMKTSDPLDDKDDIINTVNVKSLDKLEDKESRPDKNESVSQYAIDMLSQLFPNRKKSVLELILKRCDLNLLKAIEQCSSINSSAFKPTTPTTSQNFSGQASYPEDVGTSSVYGPIMSYPKWFLPMSIPVTMGHLPNLFPRCTLPNCMCNSSVNRFI
ncbi:hypothetical protein ACFFRR_007946 [Megaselia abdita]